MGLPLLVRQTQNPVSALTQRVSVSFDTKLCVKIAPVIFFHGIGRAQEPGVRMTRKAVSHGHIVYVGSDLLYVEQHPAVDFNGRSGFISDFPGSCPPA